MIAFFGGVIRGFTGFAGSLFMLPCYALLLGPIAGMNIIIVSGLVGVAFTVKRAIKYSQKKNYPFLQLGSLYWCLYRFEFSFSE